MRPFQNILSTCSKTGLLLLAMMVWNCSTPASLEDEGFIVINNTSMTLVYGVMELETSYKAFTAPKFVINPDHKIVHEGRSAIILKEDITAFNFGDDIKINLWEVIGDSAFIRAGITLMNEELEQWEFRAQIKEDEEGDLVVDSARE